MSIPSKVYVDLQKCGLVEMPGQTYEECSQTGFEENYRMTIAKRAYDTCTARGDEVFSDVQNGVISAEESYIYKYTKGLADVGITIDAETALCFQDRYLYYQHNLRPEPEVLRVMSVCKEYYDAIGVITNGPGEHQRRKLTDFGIIPFLDENLIIISGETGLIKPDLRVFELAQKRCGCRPEEIIYVGDSLARDIEPARRMGWKTLWINRKSGESLTVAQIHSLL